MGISDTGPIRVLVVDDHEMVRRGIDAMLSIEDDIVVCATAASAAEAIAKAEEFQPDVVLLDVRLGPDGTGIDAARVIHTAVPTARVAMFTGLARDADVVAALMAGATGFVLKGLDQEELADTIRTIAAGGNVFDKHLTAAVLDRLHDDDDADADPRLASLSPREHEILRLMAEGHSNREIAETLFLSEKTVKNHITRLLAKLGVQRRTEAIRLATAHR